MAFDTDPDARVAVLFFSVGTFCAGFDLTYAEFPSKARARWPSSTSTRWRDRAPRGPMGPTRLELSEPVIAAVAGAAVAGGMELALWCDIRVMEEDAYFGVYCQRWGVPLIDGGAIRLPRLVGMGRALEIILTGRRVSAEECLRIGACEQMVPPGQSRAAAECR